jgi:hypothetical protein
MAAMAARMFFCRLGKIVRSTVVTGSFTGAETCGAAAGAAEGGGVMVCALAIKPLPNKNRIAAKIRFINSP